MSGQHALYAPSAFPVTAHCSGSVLAAQAVPDRETQETREGDAVHWVAAECLTAWSMSGSSFTAMAFDWLGKTAPNGVVIDQEMVDGADLMVSDVLAVCNQHGGLRRLLIEHRVKMPRIHPTSCWGTLDVALDLRYVGLVYLWEFKYGHGQIEAYENYQGVGYMEGLREKWGIDGHADQKIEVHIRIVQPRCYRQSGPVDEWVVMWSGLRGYVNQLASQVREAERNPHMQAGKHCRYCPARSRCPAARQGGYHLIDYVKVPFEIETLSDADLATERQILKDGSVLLTSRLGAIDDELEHRIKAGAANTGLALEAGKGNLNWTVPPAQAAAFAQQFGVDNTKEAVLTPTQTIAKTPVKKRPLITQALKAVAARGATGLKLVPASDSRTARAFQRSK